MSIKDWFEKLLHLADSHPQKAALKKFLTETRAALAAIEHELYGMGEAGRVAAAVEGSTRAGEALVEAARGAKKGAKKGAKPAAVAPVAPPPAPKKKPLPASDEAFAAAVLDAARASKTGRFGGDKVFISHVIAQLGREGFEVEDVDGIKARMVAAHRANLMHLTRADLVDAMHPDDVDQSEAAYLKATFHFVGLGHGRRP